jgi:hypothetical protein
MRISHASSSEGPRRLAMLPHSARHPRLVLAHQARAADNIDGEDRGEAAGLGHSAPYVRTLARNPAKRTIAPWPPITARRCEGSRHSQNAFGSPACFKTSFAVCLLFERGTMTTRLPSASIHFSWLPCRQWFWSNQPASECERSRRKSRPPFTRQRVRAASRSELGTGAAWQVRLLR